METVSGGITRWQLLKHSLELNPHPSIDVCRDLNTLLGLILSFGPGEYFHADKQNVHLFNVGLYLCQRRLRLNIASHFYVPIKDFLNGCQPRPPPPRPSPVRVGQPYLQNIQVLLLQFNIKI